MKRKIIIDIDGSHDYIYLFLFKVQKLLEEYRKRGLFEKYDVIVGEVDER